MDEKKLFMILLGCTPKGRFTEQHDVFFGIGSSLRDLLPQMNAFWPEAKGQLHIDAWRTVTKVGGHNISVVEKAEEKTSGQKLFFINLGGYKLGEFDEFHYKIVAVADSIGNATKQAKQSAFYKHCHIPGAVSHVDDKYGIDVDDQYNVEDMLSDDLKSKYAIQITPTENLDEDPVHLGYLKFSKL